MKPLVIYHTRTQNTAQVAQVIANALKADLMLVERVTEQDLRGRPLIGLGSGIYWTRLDSRIYATASRLPRDATIFTFATSGFRQQLFVDFYQLRIKKRMARYDIQTVGHWHCPGCDKHPLTRWMGLSRGRPDSRDLDAARSFALRMKRALVATHP